MHFGLDRKTLHSSTKDVGTDDGSVTGFAPEVGGDGDEVIVGDEVGGSIKVKISKTLASLLIGIIRI